MPHRNEAERLDALRKLNLLDTMDSIAFDRITRLASRLFGVPIALVSLVDQDRQWFKSRVGLAARETPREQAFCDFTMRSNAVMVVPDATKDPRFQNNPLVTGDLGIRFYAGAPLITGDGYGLGSLCVIDNTPRIMSDDDQQTLKDLSDMVMDQINLRHAAGHVDAFSGLPNRNQLFEDLDDLSNDNIETPYLAMVIDLLSPERLEEIIRAVGLVHSDMLIRETANLLRARLGDKVVLYHLDNTRYACLLKESHSNILRDTVAQLSECFFNIHFL